MAHNLTQSADLESSSSQYAFITDASQTGLDITGNITLEGWVNFESLPTSGNTFAFAGKYDFDNNNRSYYFAINNNAGTYRFLFVTSDTGIIFTQAFQNLSSAPSTGTWYHYAASKSSSTVTFYIDGVSEGTGTVDSSQFNGNADFSIGSIVGNAATFFFDGKLSLWRAWSSARSQSEIDDNKCNVLGSTTNLEGEWTFDNVLTDNSGNGNTLTNSGGFTFVSDVPAICTAAVDSTIFFGTNF